MCTTHEERLASIYPACRAELESPVWNLVVADCENDREPATLPDRLQRMTEQLNLPPYLTDLAKLESIMHDVKVEKEVTLPEDHIIVNPTLQLFRHHWKGLPALVDHRSPRQTPRRKAEDTFTMVWKNARTGEIRAKEATKENLLVLKIVVEDMDPHEIARENNLPLGGIDAGMESAIQEGLLLAPTSRIRRNATVFSKSPAPNDRFMASPTFAVQWHITQACDLHCKHCYDRTNRSPLEKEQAYAILEDLRLFCHSRNVTGHVSFTGGNPLLHPYFFDLYQRAVELGFGVAILGNPAPKETLERLITIKKPGFFQTSLEGLEAHNDYIRGTGHYDRSMAFLEVLRQLDIYAIVMLTLTKENMAQILPLSQALKNRADAFFFNRLSAVGEGAGLNLPSPKAFAAFLEQYHEATQKNTILGLKDNLFNIIRYKKGETLFDGCSGYGCGAAFNFVAILSDGAVHACRKFPSPIGNVFDNSLAEIYDSPKARKYRRGCRACDSCDLRPACGGCLAIAHSHGLNIFEERDPYCFLSTPRH